ncbi:Pol polyprotein [Plakobranchus ocellatus]|uniref:Pol polyprotein n=1 Tax=Plakobranchus ocellatus TaxID=259542 RepID=A0AAV4BMA7_9GAST|nr:Pol polyprotein [Plakobranchus ocellatus]
MVVVPKTNETPSEEGFCMVVGIISSRSFHKRQELLSSTPILAHYSPSRETIIAADASNQGLGTVLLQSSRGWDSQASELYTPHTKPAEIVEKEDLAAT